ncbi:MAG: CNNM domain-containing protein [Candidatus Micrarchaeota archaeon]
MELEIAAFAIMLFLSAAFSAAEAAILSISRIRLRYLRDKHPGSKRVASLYRLKSHTPRTIMTILIGNNVANIGASFLAAHYTVSYFGDVYLGLATAVVTLVVLVFAEVVPKNYATADADAYAMLVAQPMEMLAYALWPVIFLLEKISAAIPGTYAIGGRKVYFSEAEIRSVFEVGLEDKAISHDEKILLEKVLDFNDTHVKEIMTPRKNVKTMMESESVSDALKKAAKYRRNRYPVLNENGKPVGVVSQKTLLSSLRQKRVHMVMSTPYFVSRESVASELFRNLQREKRQIAIVLAADGTMDGIVTMEDLLEEIVGEIEEGPANINREQGMKSVLVVSGDARLHDVEKELGVALAESQRFGSVGAFIQYQLKRLPVKGDVIISGKVKMEVAEVGENFSLSKVRVLRL